MGGGGGVLVGGPWLLLPITMAFGGGGGTFFFKSGVFVVSFNYTGTPFELLLPDFIDFSLSLCIPEPESNLIFLSSIYSGLYGSN